MTDASRILKAIEQGDPRVANQLLPLVYDELRQLAASSLAAETPGQTLTATSLVHEAYMRLVGGDPDQPWDGRGHFFAAAAEAMRRILIEKARRKKALRHGGKNNRVALDEAQFAEQVPDDRLLAVDEVLDQLAQEQKETSDVVKLRFFVGLTIEETASALNISVRTANRHWAYARAWLYQRLKTVHLE